jgi:hypothetical protein
MQQQQRLARPCPRHVERRAVGLKTEVLDHWRSLDLGGKKGPGFIIPRLVWSLILA